MRGLTARQHIRESRGPAYGPGRRGSNHPAIRRQRFPGELALTDLHPGGDAESATRALARYAAIRYAWLALQGAPQLGEEKQAAAEYVHAAIVGMTPPAAASLQGLLDLDAASTPLEAARWLQRAGVEARLQGAAGAAAACWRLTYQTATDAGEWAAAMQAAESLADMAAHDGAMAAMEIWSHRAQRIRKRLEI